MPLQTLGWAVRTMPFLERAQAKYGDMLTMKIAQEGPWVMVSDPDMVKQVFKGDPEVFRAGEGNAILSPLVGSNSVLTLDGSRAHGPAQADAAALPRPADAGLRRAHAEIAEREIDSWPSGGPLTLWPRMQAITLEIILQAVFGLEEGPRLEALREPPARRAGGLHRTRHDAADRAPRHRAGSSAEVVRRELDPADELIYEQIRERREDPDLDEPRATSSRCCCRPATRTASRCRDDELRDELVTLLVAGHETTATSLAWTMERLVRHPGALERLRDEVAAGEDEYLDAVVKETLRLRPVLPVVVRRLLAGHRGRRAAAAGRRGRWRPASTWCTAGPTSTPSRARFRPERFLEQPAGTYTWIPFGGGVRRCLGASFALFEMKQVLTAMMSRVEPRPAAADVRARDPARDHHEPARGGEVTSWPRS